MKFTTIDAGRCQVGESPVWDDLTGRLYWVDILAGEVHCLTLDSGERRSWCFGEPIGALGLSRSQRLVLAMRETVALFDVESEALSVVARITHAKSDMRLNDGKVGPDGAFWVGSIDVSPDAPAAVLYRIEGGGGVRVEAEGLRVSNGLAWTADGKTMFHSDSRGVWIDILDFDPVAGRATNRRRLVDLDEQTGRPDGGACDINGDYWSAGISAGHLNRFTRDGVLAERIAVPSFRPTMPCFGGPDGKTLFVTSLSSGQSPQTLEQYPLCGAVISLRPGVAGVPAFRFDA